MSNPLYPSLNSRWVSVKSLVPFVCVTWSVHGMLAQHGVAAHGPPPPDPDPLPLPEPAQSTVGNNSQQPNVFMPSSISVPGTQDGTNWPGQQPMLIPPAASWNGANST